MKKKGFTLIELLAVIIVIAVIAVITVPTILGVIDKARKASYKDSIYGIMDSARIYLTMNQENIKANEEIEFVCNGINCSRPDNGDNLLFKGEVPRSESVYLQADGSILVESVYNGKYYANNETGEVVITEDDTTLTRGELTKLVNNLQDELTSVKKELNTVKSENTTIKNDVSSLISDKLSIDKVYPVGSIYISTSNVDPATLFKGTTWERYAENRTLVGTSGTAEQTGGNNSVSNLNIYHTHSYNTVTPHVHGLSKGYAKIFQGIADNSVNSLRIVAADYSYNLHQTITKTEVGTYSSAGGNATALGGQTDSVATSTANTGAMSSNSTINAQDPYITVYMWKRNS